MVNDTNLKPPPAALIARLLSHTAVRFVIVGVINTLTGLSVIFLLKWALAVPDVAANLAGYGLGLIVSYFLNARWTFSFRGPLRAGSWRFILTIVVAYLTNLATVSAALYWFSINSYVSQAAGVAPYALVTYFLSKHFVFADRFARVTPHLTDPKKASSS